MGCCVHCQAAEGLFGTAMARRDLRRYHRKGPDKTTRLMLGAIRAKGVSGATLLDVGAGVGVLHHELLGQEVASATHVEASSAYLAEARAETTRRGNAGWVDFVEGDFVDVALQVSDADVVTLDRVICCYPDYPRLLDAAGRKARHMCALSYPRDRWGVRLAFGVLNLFCRLRGSAFRVFVHPSAAVDAAMRKFGFRQCSFRTTVVWQVRLYERHTVGDVA